MYPPAVAWLLAVVLSIALTSFAATFPAAQAVRRGDDPAARAREVRLAMTTLAAALTAALVASAYPPS
jgi:hypothetical protein